MIAKIGKDRGGDRHLSGCAHQDRISIRRLPGDEFSGDPAASAHAIFDHRRGAGILLKLLHHEASEQVIAAARGKADNEMDRSVRIIRLRACVSRICKQE